MKRLFITQLLTLLLLGAATVSAQTTEFPYSDILTGSTLPDGTYTLRFKLFDSASGGAQVGTTLNKPDTQVTSLAFSVTLDYGLAAFPGADRYLEVSYRDPVTGLDTVISPRRKILSLPYSIRAARATYADDASKLHGAELSDLVQVTDPRLTDSRDPNPGSGNYIQNGTLTQAGNFNISGSGTAGFFNAGQYKINGLQVLKTTSNNNVFVGPGAGASSVLGGNTFVGNSSGLNNTTGHSNSFLGSASGAGSTTGTANSFFGHSSGVSNTTGSQNSYFGMGSGSSSGSAVGNSFFGYYAGFYNTGSKNSFFGFEAGKSNTTGEKNTFMGNGAGTSNTYGHSNTFVGDLTGSSNTAGQFNTFIGNSSGRNTVAGHVNAFVGHNSGLNNTSGSANAFFGNNAGSGNIGGNHNTFLGDHSGNAYGYGQNNTAIGSAANLGADSLSYATAIGSGSVVSTSNTIALGRTNGSDKVRIFGLGTAGSTQLCRNANNEIASCSSSLRYKSNIRPFGFGLDLVKRLRPITFDWKDGGLHDLGLGAEDVAAIEPLLAVYDKDGNVEGVKYDRIGVVLLNAVKEQQAQIDAQKKQLEDQQKLIEGLRLMLCEKYGQAAVCQK